MSCPRPILGLVAKEPTADPRIGWVTQLSSEVAPTDVLGAVWSTTRPRCEYDGRIYVERVPIFDYASLRAKVVRAALGGLLSARPARARVEHLTRLDLDSERNGDGHVAALLALVGGHGDNTVLMSALRERALGASTPPGLIICHDLTTLPVGLDLGRRFCVKVVYDCHEYWPDVNPLVDSWERGLIERFERHYVVQADAVVTVSPPLARHLERTYGLEHVVAAPNVHPKPRCMCELAPVSQPVKFLYQGGASPVRRTHAFLEHWARIDEPRAVLYMRCPSSPYVADLEHRFAALVERGRLVFLPAVEPSELIEAASFADVGVIPYDEPSVNYRLSCPNKLTEYLQAGLALLTTPLVYVDEIVRRYECGTTFDANDAASLAEAVAALVQSTERLQAMKRNALRATQSDLNWETQSTEYREVLERFHRAA